GARLSESTVGRATVDAGARLQGHAAAGDSFTGPTPWAWRPDARGRPTAYVSIDATGVRQQGPGGAAAEGRMAYVGMVFHPAPDPARPRPPAGPGPPPAGDAGALRQRPVPPGRDGAAVAAAGGAGGHGGGRGLGGADRRRQRPGGLRARQLRPARPGGDPGLLARRQLFRGAGTGGVPGGRGGGREAGGGVVPAAEGGGRRAGAGGGAGMGLRAAAVEGLAGAVGAGGRVLRQQRASHGVPGVPGGGLADRQRGGGERVQDGGGAAAEGGGDALG